MRIVALPDIIAHRAGIAPQATCVQEVGGGELTYQDVLDHTVLWWRALSELGIREGNTVLTAIPTSAVSLELWCGIAKSRAIEVPLNPALRGALLSHVVTDSLARVAVVHARVLDSLRDALEAAPALEHIVVVGGGAARRLGAKELAWETLAAAARERPEQPPAELIPEHQTACLLYTSGTTGASKGVVMPWAQFDEGSSALLRPSDIDEFDAAYCPFPPFHITLRCLLISMSRAGGRIVLRDRFSTDEFWRDVEAYKCTVTIMLGAMANFLYRQADQPKATPLRRVIMTPVMPEIEDFKARYGVEVKPLYGMTEISGQITSLDWDVSRTRSCGKLRPGQQARIVDENDYDVPEGQPGELIIRSDRPWALAGGYWRNPAATASAWRNLWFHTGDLFTRDDDGYYYFVDRLKDSIRRRGENISSAEVEAGVMEHPDVLECAAVGVPSKWGEEEVMIFVVPKAGQVIDPAQIHEFLQTRLAAFMQPEFIEVVRSLPKTPTEKVRKVDLRDRGVGPATWHNPRTQSRTQRTKRQEAAAVSLPGSRP